MGGSEKKPGASSAANEITARAAAPASVGKQTLTAPPSGLIAPDANHPARDDAHGNQLIQIGQVTERGLASIGGRTLWKALATATESVEIRDDSGDTLRIDATYRLETRPAELGELPDVWVHTERHALLTVGSGEHAGATIIGQARVALDPEAALDPRAAIAMPGLGAAHWASVYLAEAEQYVPVSGPGGRPSLRADGAADDVLAYDDPLRMLVGLKNILQHQHVAHHGAAVGAMHARAARLLAEARHGRAWLEQALADIATHHDRSTILPIQWTVVDIDAWLAENQQGGRDDTEDARLLRLARGELRGLLDAVVRARPPERDPVTDLAEAPGRFAERAGKGLVEVGAMITDAVVLGVDAIGTATGIGSFDYHPRSDYGKAVERSGAGAKAMLVTAVNGFADQWSDAIERAHHGDYRGLTDVSIDTLMMIDGARSGGAVVLEHGDAIVSRFAALGRSARTLIGRLPAEAAEAAAVARAMADGAEAFVAEVVHGGPELATPGGPPVPAGTSFAKARGAAGDAFQASRLASTRASTLEAIKSTLGRAKAPNAEQWLARVESLFEGEPQKLSDFFRQLELHAKSTNPALFMRKLESLMNRRIYVPTDLRLMLSKIFGAKHADPAVILEEIEWLSTRQLSAESRSMLATRAAKGHIDLHWVKRTALTERELEMMGKSNNEDFREFEQASDIPSRRQPGRLADRAPSGKTLAQVHPKIRGTAAELVAEQTPLPDGLKIHRRVFGADATSTDYELRTADGQLAELEVKGLRPESWKRALDEYDNARRSGLSSSNSPVDRLIRQVDGGIARGHKVYVAIGDATPMLSRNRLLTILGERVAPIQLLLLPESEILRVGRVLREHMGIPQPAFPGGE